MIVVGVDPGLTGGLAAVQRVATGGIILRAAVDVPTLGEKAKRRVDVGAVIEFLRHHNPDHAVIERAQAMPDQGSSSGFIYGRAVGALEACIQGMQIPMTVIESTAWKKSNGLAGRDKEDSRQRACQLFPGTDAFARKMDHGRAEASLIAWHGLMLLRELDQKLASPAVATMTEGQIAAWGRR